MTVIDASAVVALLDPVQRGDPRLLASLPSPFVPWLAPDVLPFEVFAATRRRRLRGELTDEQAVRVLDRFRRFPVVTFAASELFGAAWALRDRFGAADALYAGLALRANEPLLTLDERMAAAARAHGIAVHELDSP